jgi:hypothetical protein
MVLLAMGVLFVAITAFVFLQHRGLFAGFAKFARRLIPEKWLSTLVARGSMIDDSVVATYRNRSVMLRASLLRLAGWATGAGEIWLVMQSLGQPIGVVDAYILESLGSGVRAATFMVPGALGALEASYVLFGAMSDYQRTQRWRFPCQNASGNWRWACRACCSGSISKVAIVCAVANRMDVDQGSLTIGLLRMTAGRPEPNCAPFRRAACG